MLVDQALREQIIAKFGIFDGNIIITQLLMNPLVTSAAINDDYSLELSFNSSDQQAIYALLISVNTQLRHGLLSQTTATDTQIAIRRVFDSGSVVLEPPPPSMPVRSAPDERERETTLAQQRGELFRSECDSYLFDFTVGDEATSAEAKSNFIDILDKSITIIQDVLAAKTKLTIAELEELETLILTKTGVRSDQLRPHVYKRVFVCLFRPDVMGYCEPNENEYYKYMNDLLTELTRRKNTLNLLPDAEFHSQTVARSAEASKHNVAEFGMAVQATREAGYASLSESAKEFRRVFLSLGFTEYTPTEYKICARFYELLDNETKLLLQNPMLSGPDIDEARYRILFAFAIARDMYVVQARIPDHRFYDEKFIEVSSDITFDFKETIDKPKFNKLFKIFNELISEQYALFGRLVEREDRGSFIAYRIAEITSPEERQLVLANLDRIVGNIVAAVSYPSLIEYLKAQATASGNPLKPSPKKLQLT